MSVKKRFGVIFIVIIFVLSIVISLPEVFGLKNPGEICFSNSECANNVCGQDGFCTLNTGDRCSTASPLKCGGGICEGDLGSETCRVPLTWGCDSNSQCQIIAGCHSVLRECRLKTGQACTNNNLCLLIIFVV